MTATGRVGRTASFARQREFNVNLFVVLFVLGVLPALIYVVWVRVSRGERFSVTATPEGGGSRLKFVGDPGRGEINRDTYLRFVRSARSR